MNEYYIKYCLKLAEQGLGNVSPNPMVGCVIVYKNNIIGEGWHQKYGESHAEVNAINSVENKELLKDSTLYVNLEPCSHWGKTPPCCDLIIRMKIPRVVVGMIDPFAKVCGEGISKMKDSGIDVRVGILEKECKELNCFFVTYNTKQRPYIIIKWAETCDGYIDNNRDASHPPTWMTGEGCRLMVHKRRSQVGAIMVGTRTLLRDNPSLTVRVCEGENPIRIVIDKYNNLPLTLNVFDNKSTTKVFNTDNINDILKSLYDQKINSLYIEGGTTLINRFIDLDFWDEMNVFTSALKVSDLSGGKNTEPKGVKAPLMLGIITEDKMIGTTRYRVSRNF